MGWVGFFFPLSHLPEGGGGCCVVAMEMSRYANAHMCLPLRVTGQASGNSSSGHTGQRKVTMMKHTITYMTRYNLRK